MWNMKKYRIVVGVWMLLLSSASCMDDTGRYGQDNRNYRITASIEDANVASRVADKNNRTSFTKNDEIFNGQRICSERFGCQPGIMDGTTECLLNEGSICLVWNYEQHLARSGDQYFHSAGPDLG